MEKLDPVGFGRRVKQRRKQLRWSQEELAKEADMSQTNIDWIEKGGPKDPRKQAIGLATALGTTADWLLYDKGPMETGLRALTPEQFRELYAILPTEAQEQLSVAARKYQQKKPARKSG